MWGDEYRVTIPAGRRGQWGIERFTVTPREEQLELLRAALNPKRMMRYTPAGTYTRLVLYGGSSLHPEGQTIMSDTPDEIRDHREPIERARGRCLINGLGIGVVLGAILKKKEVQHVTVIENSPEVIALVAPHYVAMHPGRVDVIHADALSWKPPKGVPYNMVWHDIWTTISGDNLPEMKRLHRTYARRCDWQGSWAYELCLRYNNI